MELYFSDNYGTLYCGDSKKTLKSLNPNSVNMIITSPPYWALRDYHTSGQLGQEPYFKDYIDNLVSYFDCAWDILKDNGTLWINIGDSYYGGGKGAGGSGIKSKKQVTNKGSYFDKTGTNLGLWESNLDNAKSFKNHELVDRNLCLIPSRFAIAMQDKGWILHNDIIWHKPNQMPFSGKKRFTQDFEHVFFFTKTNKYYFEQQLEDSLWASKDSRTENGRTIGGQTAEMEYAVKGSGTYRKDNKRNKRSVWSINTEPVKGLNHFAKYPTKLIETPIKAGCPEGGIVMDIFFGSGTTGVVCERLNRKWIGLELNSKYCDIAIERIINARTN